MYMDGEVVRYLQEREPLKEKVEAFFRHEGWEFPSFMREGPYLVLARHVATCRFEDLFFCFTARRLGLEPVWVEYTADLFCSTNPDKRDLWKIRIFCGMGRKEPRQMVARIIRDPSWWEGKPLSQIKTKWGEGLVEFHHRLRHTSCLTKYKVVDLSEWLHRFGEARNYYFPYLLLFVAHGVLFEDFHAQIHGLEKFRINVVEPALKKIKGVGFPPPLILRIPPNKYIGWYPRWVRNYIP